MEVILFVISCQDKIQFRIYCKIIQMFVTFSCQKHINICGEKNTTNLLLYVLSFKFEFAFKCQKLKNCFHQINWFRYPCDMFTNVKTINKYWFFWQYKFCRLQKLSSVLKWQFEGLIMFCTIAFCIMARYQSSRLPLIGKLEKMSRQI